MVRNQVVGVECKVDGYAEEPRVSKSSRCHFSKFCLRHSAGGSVFRVCVSALRGSYLDPSDTGL